MKYITTTVLSNDEIAPNIRVLVVERQSLNPIAGQFFMLQNHENALPLMRPISIFKVEPTTLHFMYRLIGTGTRRLAQLKANDLIDLLGPSGNGFPCAEVKGKIAVLGGGLGIPPLCETAKELQQHNIQVDAYLGYRDMLFALEDFEPYCNNIFVSSEVGPEGYRGFITDLLKPAEYNGVFTCGPDIMMRKVAAMCQEANVPCWCSVEQHMACGIGACLGCSIRTKSGMKRVCKDGPVFLSSEIFEL